MSPTILDRIISKKSPLDMVVGAPNGGKPGKRLLIITLVSAILVCTVMLFVQATIEKQYRASISNTLTTTLDDVQAGVDLWYQERKDDARLWARHQEVIAGAKELLRLPQQKEALINAPAQHSLRELLRPVLDIRGYQGFFIISPDSLNLASTRDENIGIQTLLADQNYFIDVVLLGNAAVSLPQFSDVPLPDESGELVMGRSTMFVGAPIKDEEGGLLAVLTFRIDPNKGFYPIIQHGRMGETGETYAFNSNAVLLNHSRFEDRLRTIGLLKKDELSVLKIHIRDHGKELRRGFKWRLEPSLMPMTEMAASATSGQNGINIDGYRDYRGKVVVGAWRWMRNLGFGLATEQDVSEAYAPLIRFRYLAAGSTIFVVLLVFGLAHFLHSSNKRTAENARRFRAVFDHVLDGLITIDTKGLVETMNPAAEKIFGYSSREVIGKNVNMLMPAPYASEHDGYIRNYLETGEAKIIGFERELEGKRKNGETFPIDLGVSEVQLHNRRLFLGIVRDITERKKVDRMKSEFVSTVSHELRTPLTSIYGSLGLLVGGAAGEMSEQAQSLLDIAHKSSDRLIRLINDILDSEKLEANRMTFNMVFKDVVELVEKAIIVNQAYAEQFGVKFVLEAKVAKAEVLTDVDRFEQIMTNLMSNAAKFSPQGGEVKLSIDCRGGNVIVSVTDRGPGIPKEFQDRLFQKFAQADSSDTRKISGTGLGLNIFKQLVGRMGGEVGFETQEGRGTTFYFSLPELGREKSEIQMEILGKSGPRILICEDDPDVAHLLSLMLKQEGIACDIAYSAKEATQMLAKRSYDSMTLDLILPDKDGLTLLRELRSKEETRNLPIIVVSVRAEEGREELNGDAFGIVDWLTKPLNVESLNNAVNRALKPNEQVRRKILHVEDDLDITKVISVLLRDIGDITGVATLKEARKQLDQGSFDLVILDIELPDGSGVDLLSHLESEDGRATPVLVFSAGDVTSDISQEVAAALVKSKTSNDKLVETIKTLIPHQAADL